MPYFVSRQRPGPDGRYFVEVAVGGRDYANPNSLVPRYGTIGEGREYLDPRRAIEVAMHICAMWRIDYGNDQTINVRCGATNVFTATFEPSTFADARAWAERQYETLPTCPRCGRLLDRQRFSHPFTDDEFCSEVCADRDFDERIAPPKEPQL